MSNVIFVTGAMTSGKSKFLIDFIKIQNKFKHRVLCFKPRTDKRDSDMIKSRDYKEGVQAHSISWELIPTFSSDYLETIDYIIVDEAQFLDVASYKHLLRMSRGYNKPIIFSGLSWDFKNEMFPIAERIYKEHPFVIELKAECYCCGAKTATNSVRLVNEKIVWEGSSIDCLATYKAICDNCLNEYIKEERGC